MTTERLEEFQFLANVLNYSRAAEKLFISQSLLSRHIKELEAELDVTLFERDTHGVRLTDEGKYFLRWIEPLLEKTRRTLSMLDDTRGGEGSVHVICAEQSLGTRLLGFFRSFMETYPRIELRLLPVPTASRREQVVESDVVISPCDFTDVLLRDVDALFLCDQEPLLAIPPFHPFGDRQELCLEELRGEKLIVPFADELFGPYARNAVLACRKCHDALHTIPAENAETGLLMVELGAGVMLIPHHLRRRVYPRTRTMPITDAECRFPIYAYRNRLSGNSAGLLFFEALREAFCKK